MQILTSNLLPLAIIGVACVCFAYFGTELQGWQRWINRVGWGLLALTVIGFFYVTVSAPGGEKTVVQPPRPVPVVPESHELIDVLQATWNTDGNPDWPVAEIMAEVSRIAYLPPSEAESEFATLGFDAVDTMVGSSMMGYVVSVGDSTVIAFRGTDDKPDWVANLNRFTDPTKHGPVHRGFQRAYQRLASQVATLLKKTEAKHIWITGHSLGGALAVLCAYDMAENKGLSIDGLITFGQPLVARPPLSDHIDALLTGKFVHYVNQSDIVPRIPPSFDYCGSLVWYTGDDIRRSRQAPLYATAAPGDEEQDETSGNGLEPMSEADFDALQKKLKEEDEPELAADGTMVVRGSLPLILHHEIGLYLDRVRVK